MNDFDYDVMQKKRIARGAAHMKRKRKGCSLPSDNLTAAQKRRLNGPVSTYKLDEPMTWESFKAMPEDLQKQYIIKLQESYQATDVMIGKMFGTSGWSVGDYRKKLGIGTVSRCGLSYDDLKIRNAKWDTFCNGVIGGKPGEVKESDKSEVEEPHDEIDEFATFDDSTEEPEQIELTVPEIPEVPKIDILKPDKLDISFVIDSCDLDKAYETFRYMKLPIGKVRIRFEIEAV